MISAGNGTTAWASINAYNKARPAQPVPRSCSRSAPVSPPAACRSASLTGWTSRNVAPSAATVAPTPTTRSTRRCDTPQGALADAEQVDDEDQRLVGADRAARAALAVGEVRRDRDPAPAADLHARDPLVPARDDLALAEAELERVAAVPGGVELLAVLPRHADVVDLDDLARDRLVAGALDDVLDLELVGRRLVGGDLDD